MLRICGQFIEERVEMFISKFKAKCLSLLEEVEKTKKSLLVTKFGKPIAEVNPPSLNQKSRSWLGSVDCLTDSCGNSRRT
jgi:hypothetical protein